MSNHPLTTYQKLCTEFYDLESHRNHEQALSFYMDYAQKADGPILEPMCGTGRFLIPMLQAGLDAQGFDASAHMLKALQEKYAKLSIQPAPVWQQFVQEFKSNKQYKLIFVPYGSWGLITNLDNAQKSLALMFQHLAPNGKLVLEIETIASLPTELGVWRRGVHTRADGSKIAINTLTSYDPITQLFSAHCRYESIIDNKIVATETEEFVQYHYAYNQLDQMLANAGFAQIKKYQDYAKTPEHNPDTQILIYECIK